jgi:hypothetical protein
MRHNNRSLEQVAAAAHRPLVVGPGEKCPYCPATFPNQEAVDALPAPATKAAKSAYATLHKGIRFGTPPLFNFPFTEIYLCILHCLLRLFAIVFQRTIELNLDTILKVDSLNSTMGALKLNCKKVGVRKKTVASNKDTEPINFIGWYVGSSQNPHLLVPLAPQVLQSPPSPLLHAPHLLEVEHLSFRLFAAASKMHTP